MFFASDNAGPVHPQIMNRLAQANTGHAMPYGNDPEMSLVRDRIREIFEAPEAAVYLVAMFHDVSKHPVNGVLVEEPAVDGCRVHLLRNEGTIPSISPVNTLPLPFLFFRE